MLFRTLDPFSPSYHPLSYELGRLFDNAEGRSTAVRSSRTEDALTLTVDLPGSRKEDVDITFEHDMLRVVAKRKDVDSKVTYRHVLSRDWDQNSAEADLTDGVLTIRLQRNERSKPRKLLLR